MLRNFVYFSLLWEKVIILLDEYDTPLQEARELLQRCGLYANRQAVKDWYDGFTCGCLVYFKMLTVKKFG